MALRSKAREVTLQLLFQHDQNAKAMPRQAVEDFANARLRSKPLAKYAIDLFDGVVNNRPAIDTVITTTADNWRLSRMMPADRNVLRLGIYELRFLEKPEPVPVVLNEAIELAKRFGTLDSAGFVNGILDKVSQKPTTSDPIVVDSKEANL